MLTVGFQLNSVMLPNLILNLVKMPRWPRQIPAPPQLRYAQGQTAQPAMETEKGELAAKDKSTKQVGRRMVDLANTLGKLEIDALRDFPEILMSSATHRQERAMDPVTKFKATNAKIDALPKRYTGCMEKS